MAVKTLIRVFLMTEGSDEVELPDPNPLYTPEEVLEHYSSQYPKLINAVAVPHDQKGDIYYYNIKDTMGVKG